MFVVLLGINHKTAPVEVRETLAISKAQIKKYKVELRNLSGVEGIIILSTCNRTEFYITTKNPEIAKASLISFVAKYGNYSVKELNKYLYLKECQEAVHHLFRVTAGLDSMILGESQILGQVQDGYNYSLEYKLSNNVLNTLFQKAITVGKRARTETLIDRQSVSVSSVAVDLTKDIFGTLNGRSVLILGAGETSELTARHLVANGITSVIVANRTFEKATQLAGELGGKAIRLNDFPQYLIEADIVISCTAAPRYIVEKKDLEPLIDLRQGKQILFIDIAVPRDIDPQVKNLINVSLYDIDDLQHVVQQNLDERKKEAVKVELIVREELQKFFKWLDCLFVIPTIKTLKEKANHIKEKELEKAFRRMDQLSKKDKKIMETMANAIINQLLHYPISELKEYAHSEKGVVYSEAIQKLFKLDCIDEDQKIGRA